jgi:subtilisin family serine protease
LAQEEIYVPKPYHNVLIVPRHDTEAADLTIAEAAVSRAARRQSLQLWQSKESTAGVLGKLGLDELEKAQQVRRPISERGLYTRMPSLGVTAAFFGHEKDQAEAMNALSNEYDFVPDFSLTLPSRVSLTDIPANRGRSALSEREWPEQSGVHLAHEQGIRGGDVLVGVLDTGVDADHQEFGSRTVTYRYVSIFPQSPYWPPRDVRGFDTDGHGTHVSGILAGEGVGVAPEASLYVASVIESETTRTSLVRVAYGLDWFLRQFSRPDNENRPAVLNMSLGFPSEAPPDINPQEFAQRIHVIRLMLRVLIQANILPIIAIGNGGPDTFGYPGAFGEFIGVGAVDYSHNVASFSGGGQIDGGGLTKPDLVGYGVGVYSSVERDYEGTSIYERFNGTSMASPYAAGIAALYRCQQPSLTVEEIRATLVDNALPLGNQPATREGAGLARFVL